MESGPRVGNKVPDMPDDYLQNKDLLAPGLALMLATPECPRRKAIFIKDSIIVHIENIDEFGPGYNMDNLPIFDAIVMNPSDIPEGAVEDAMEQAKKNFQ